MKKFGRCVLITNGNLASLIALRDWLDAHGQSIVKVYITYKLPSSKSNLQGLFSLLMTSGWSYTWLKIWVNKIAPLILRVQGKPSSVKNYLQVIAPAVPVELIDSVKAESVLAEIRSLNPDILVSFSATQRFPDSLINIFTSGAINVHYGALPRYAGLSPYFWHLYNNERYYGVTLHRIESKLDAGGVVEQKEDLINSNDCLSLMIKMASKVSPMLNNFFAGLTSIDELVLQDSSRRTYFGHPTVDQVKEFHSNGFKMMDGESRKLLLEKVLRK